MKLVIIITDFGSFNNFLAELSLSFLKDNSNELHVICDNTRVINLEDKYDYKLSNLIFHFIPFCRGANIIKTFSTALKVRRIIKMIKPDLVHAHFTTAAFPTILLKVRGIPYWATFHGLGMNSVDNFIDKIVFGVVEITCFFRLDRIFVLNEEDFILVKKLGFLKKGFKYKCFGVGCDLDKFNPSNFNKQAKFLLRESLGISNRFILTFTGRFVKFKGFDVVVRSFIKLNETFPNKYVLLLIGGIDKGHPSGLTIAEEEYIRENSAVKSIGFTNEVQKYLAITDMFIFPSKKEGLPTCIMESLAMSVPVIVSDARGSNDIVIDNFNGFLLGKNTDEVVEIFDLVKRISENETLLDKMKRNITTNTLRFSRQAFVDYHLERYQMIKNSVLS